MGTHFSILAWRIPWTEEPGKLQAMGSQRVRHNLNNLVSTHAYIHTHTHTHTHTHIYIYLLCFITFMFQLVIYLKMTDFTSC